MLIEADEENHFGIEIERLLLPSKPREYFNVATGRYHTAIAYHNTAYHHGRRLQTGTGKNHRRVLAAPAGIRNSPLELRLIRPGNPTGLGNREFPSCAIRVQGKPALCARLGVAQRGSLEGIRWGDSWVKLFSAC